MHKYLVPSCTLMVLLAACAGTQPHVAPQAVKVYASSATYPWLETAFGCAPSSGAAVVVSSRQAADVLLQFGEPMELTLPAYRIGSDDLLVVVQPQTGIGPLTLHQVRDLFAGQIYSWSSLGGADLPVQVWSFAASEDVQRTFEDQVMRGQPIVSLARLAVSAQAMSDAVGSTPGAIGILPRRWKAGNTSAVYTLPALPVLAVTSSAPHGAEQSLLACLQSSAQ